VRYGREGQDNAASDFGVCVAGPVRPLVAMPIGPSLPHAHKAPTHKPALAHRRETDGEIRITDARSDGVAPAASAATSGMARFSAGLSYYELAVVHISCQVSSPPNIRTSRYKQEHRGVVEHGSYCKIRLTFSRRGTHEHTCARASAFY
jgi:hypothetical protein